MGSTKQEQPIALLTYGVRKPTLQLWQSLTPFQNVFAPGTATRLSGLVEREARGSNCGAAVEPGFSSTCAHPIAPVARSGPTILLLVQKTV